MCYFQSLQKSTIHIFCGITVQSKYITLCLAWFLIAIAIAVSFIFREFAYPSEPTWRTLYYWIPIAVGMSMSSVIIGVYSRSLMFLVPGGVTYSVMLLGLLLLIYIFGCFTINPRDAATHIGGALGIDTTTPPAQYAMAVVSFLLFVLCIFSVQVPITGLIALGKFWTAAANENRIQNSLNLNNPV